MKIKAVCQATGLTDRTVRYYIEEELLLPDFTENYLGRKTFDFCEADIQRLQDIAVLRKYGFTVTEIREMSCDPGKIPGTVVSLQERKRDTVQREEQLLQALCQLPRSHIDTVSHLAACLSAPVTELPVPTVDSRWVALNLAKRTVKATIIFVLLWAPILLSLLMVANGIHVNYYPVFSAKWILLTVAFLSPSWVYFLLAKFRPKKFHGSVLKKILLLLCILSIPFSFVSSICVISRSETRDIRDYRRFDADCLANRDQTFQDFFPTWPNYISCIKLANGEYASVYLDTEYLYRDLPAIDYTYDIYAEWPLEQDEFDKEVTRVTTLFEEISGDDDLLTVVQRGRYTCLFLTGSSYEPIFEEVHDNYTYYIFAYDPDSLRVRYLCCDSLENGADQPYYLSLDWS